MYQKISTSEVLITHAESPAIFHILESSVPFWRKKEAPKIGSLKTVIPLAGSVPVAPKVKKSSINYKISRKIFEV